MNKWYKLIKKSNARLSQNCGRTSWQNKLGNYDFKLHPSEGMGIRNLRKHPKKFEERKLEEGIRAGRKHERSRGEGGGGAGASRKFNLKEYLFFYIWSGTGRSWLILVGIGKDKIIFIRGKGAYHVMVGTVTRNPTIGVGMVSEKV